MKFYLFIFLAIFSLIFVSCETDSRDNSRAYVEGKITGNNLNYLLINVVLEDENKLIAEVTPGDNGQFTLSGPILTDSFTLGINRKIKSFSASKTGCTLSSDSMKIIVPARITYITFNEIVLE